jgi:hypothetical protein
MKGGRDGRWTVVETNWRWQGIEQKDATCCLGEFEGTGVAQPTAFSWSSYQLFEQVAESSRP